MEYIYKIKIVLLLFVFSFALAETDIDYLWSTYKKGDINALYEVKAEILANNSKDMRVLFFKTLFQTDAEIAFTNYQQIIGNTQDGELRFLAAKKIYEYYYAKGFYVTADEIKTRFGLDKEVIIQSNGNSSLELPPLKFVLQLGAFSERHNADKLINRISSLDKTIMIKTKDISGQQLHLVWVGPFNDRPTAEEWAKKIEVKYNIQSRIKPMD